MMAFTWVVIGVMVCGIGGVKEGAGNEDTEAGEQEIEGEETMGKSGRREGGKEVGGARRNEGRGIANLGAPYSNGGERRYLPQKSHTKILTAATAAIGGKTSCGWVKKPE
jgi:hypothetical protein